MGTKKNKVALDTAKRARRDRQTKPVLTVFDKTLVIKDKQTGPVLELFDDAIQRALSAAEDVGQFHTISVELTKGSRVRFKQTTPVLEVRTEKQTRRLLEGETKQPRVGSMGRRSGLGTSRLRSDLH